MPDFPAFRLNPYYTALRTWLTTALNDDGTIRDSAVQSAGASVFADKTATEAAIGRTDPGSAGSAGQRLALDGSGNPAWEPPVVIDVSQPRYALDLTGSTDQTTELQDALTEAESFGYGAILRIPYGRVRVSSTTTWPQGVAWQGGFGSGDNGGGNKLGFPRLLWYGANTDYVIETDATASGWDFMFWDGIQIHGWAGNRAKSGIAVHDKADSGLSFTRWQMANMEDYGIEFLDGGINTYIHHWRTDQCGKGSIRWVVNGADDLDLFDFAADNQVSWGTTSGAVLVVEGGSAPNNALMTVTATHGKIETNKNLATGQGHFWFQINPGNTGRRNVKATFIDVDEYAAGGITQNTGVLVDPASDFESIRLINSKLEVAGIPAYAMESMQPSSAWVVDTTIAPMAPSVSTALSTVRQVKEHIGDFNLAGRMNQHSKHAAPIIHMATSDLTGTTLYAGDLIMDPATRSSGRRVIRECTNEGTLGTLTGIQISTTSGSADVTVTAGDITQLRVGQKISFNTGSSTTKRIEVINYDTGVMGLQSSVGINTSTGTAVSFAAPQFRDYSLVEQQAAEGDAAGWTDATAQAKFNALLAKLRNARVIAP